jgi:rod shape-determining protein MreC
MGNGNWRIARTRGRAHLPLTVVAVLAVFLVLFGKAQSTLFDRARTGVIDWMRPALVATREPIEAFHRFMGSIGNIFWVYQENLRLKEENARLKQWHNTAQVLTERLKRYQLLLNAVPDPALSTTVARVIGRSNHPFLSTMILDAGKANGVKPGQAVVDQRGMIGRVYLTGEHTSWVILLTDLNSRIPVSIEPNTDQAIMSGDNSPMPMIETLARGVELKPDSQVVTSGDGDLLPAGLPIGIIVKDGAHYRVALFADQTTAQDVEIVDFKHKPEHPPSVTEQELPVTAAGLAPAQPQPQVANSLAMPLPPPLYVPPVPPGQKPATPAANAPVGQKPVTPAATEPGDQ